MAEIDVRHIDKVVSSIRSWYDGADESGVAHEKRSLSPTTTTADPYNEFFTLESASILE